MTSIVPSVRGHQHLTDVYLLTRARHHGGIVATFDPGLGQLAAGVGSAIDAVAT